MEGLFDMKYSKSLGRYMVSKKSFKAGDTIFVEAPILVSPPTPNHVGIEQTQFLCIGCYKVIKIRKALRCNYCSWYACSYECTQIKWHSDFECIVFHDEGIPPNIHSLKYLYLVRAFLIKKKNFKVWSEILRLSPVIEIMDEELTESVEAHAKEASIFMISQCGLDVDRELVKILLKIFFINTFTISTYDADENNYKGEALFATSCLLSHSCAPNMDWILLATNESIANRWEINIFARRDIKMGEVLSIAYSQDYLTMGIPERRFKMEEYYHFQCKCDRCKDPTELDTNYSTIICEMCNSSVLPEDPFDWHTDWVCTSPECGNRVSDQEVDVLNSTYLNTITQILQSTDAKARCAALNEMIVNCQSEYHLHPNHNIVIRATVHWVIKTDLTPLLESSHEADKFFEILTTRGTRCIQIVSKLGNLDAWIVCENAMAKIMAKYHFKSEDGLSIIKDDYPLEEKRALVKRIVRHFKKGMHLALYFPYEPKLTALLTQMLEGYNFWRKLLYEANVALNRPDEYTPETHYIGFTEEKYATVATTTTVGTEASTNCDIINSNDCENINLS